jgi:hypothetical protein
MRKKMHLLLAALAIVAVTMACGLFNGADTATEEAFEAAPPTPVANVPDVTEEPAQQPDTNNQEAFNVEALDGNLKRFVVRPEDLPDDYKILPGGEVPSGNSVLLYDMGEVLAKRYIVDTGRVDGWYLELERAHKADVIPYILSSKVELFETVEGAETAFSEAWLPVYLNEEKTPNWVENGCDFGDECLMYFYEDFDPASNLTNLQYEIVFLYDNMMATIIGRGLDIDMNPDYIRNVAGIVHEKIETAARASR